MSGNIPNAWRVWKAVYVKDVLRPNPDPGWPTEMGLWKVTAATIRDIFRDTSKFIGKGATANLTWDHNPSGKAICGKVLGVRVVGDELQTIIGTNDPEVMRVLANGGNVSVEVDPEISGPEQKNALTALSISQNCIVTHQRPAKRILSKRRIRMADKIKLRTEPGATRKQLAEGDPPSEGGGESAPPDDATEISVSEVVTLLNKHFDVTIPTDVDTVKELRLVLETMLAGEEEEEPDAPADAPPVDAMAADMPMAAARKRLAKLQTENALLKEKMANAKRRTLARAQENFTAAVDGLIETGRVKPAEKDEILAVGKKSGWALAILRPIQALAEGASVPVGSKRLAKTGATGTAPKVGTTPEAPSAEDCKKAAAAMRGVQYKPATT